MSEASPPPGAILEAPCAAIAEATQGLLSWEFDPRFRAAIATFPASDQQGIKTGLQAGFDQVWTTADLASAPERVRELAKKVGGLRGGQLLFAAHSDTDPILFGLWWPWGNGQTISIRVLFSARTLDEPSKAALLASFKGWFGLAG